MNLSIHSEHQHQVTIVIMIDLLILAALHCNPVYTLYTIQEHNIFMFVHSRTCADIVLCRPDRILAYFVLDIIYIFCIEFLLMISQNFVR